MIWLSTLIIIALAVAFVVVVELAERARVQKLLDRPCAGIRWVRRFPDASHAEIRAFLRRFADAFVFDRVHACKFAPDDQFLAVYDARYIPNLSLDDHLEFDSLADMLKTHYSINFETVWHDKLTLGELFVLVRDKSRK